MALVGIVLLDATTVRWIVLPGTGTRDPPDSALGLLVWPTLDTGRGAFLGHKSHVASPAEDLAILS